MKQETKKQYFIRKGKGMLIYTIVFLVVATVLQMFSDRFPTVFYIYMVCACLYIVSHAFGFQPARFNLINKDNEFWEKKKEKRELPSSMDVIFSLYTLILPFIYSSIIGLS